MFRVQELAYFGTPTSVTAPQLPSAALVGAPFTQTSDDPLFTEISLTPRGYRTAPRHFADGGARRTGDEHRRAVGGRGSDTENQPENGDGAVLHAENNGAGRIGQRAAQSLQHRGNHLA